MSIDRLKAALSDRYRIERELGAGGMATVYLAHDVKHDREVAIKVLREDLSQSLGADRFLREIKISAKLQHPHILPLLDSGIADGLLYYVMPFVSGQSLRERLTREGELPVNEAVRLLIEIVDALATAHQHGVVHRDIKPDNVMITGRHALVADFGIAKAISEATGEHTMTTQGVTLGTPAYMSPEQAAADPHIDHRSDIYAIGAMAYELLTGRPPFTGTTQQQVLAAHVTMTADPPSRHRPGISAPLDAVVLKCLEKRPADRFQTAEELLAQLEPLAGTSATPTGMQALPVTRGALEPKRSTLALSAVLVVVLAIVGWFVLHGRSSGRTSNSDLIVVFPFRITGDNSVLHFRGDAVVDLLQSDLPGADKLHVVSAQTAISAWQRAGGTDAVDLSEVDAARAARALGAGVVIQGSIVASGNHLEMNATATDLSGGSAQQHASQSGPTDSVVELVHRLAGQLLSLRAGEDTRRASYLAGVPLPAVRAYLDGQVALRQTKWDSAWFAFSHALEIDSTFALAGLGQGLTGWYFTAPNSPKGSVLAWKYRDKLSPRDLILLSGLHPKPSGDVVSLIDELRAREQAASTLGDDPEAWFILGDIYFHLGNVAGIHPDTALQRAERAFELSLKYDPQFGPAIEHRIDIALDGTDTALVRRLADSFSVALKTLPVERYAIAVALHDSTALKAWHETLPTLDLTTLYWAQIFAVGMERPADALEASNVHLHAASTAGQRRTAIGNARTIALMMGQPQSADARSNELRKDATDSVRANHATAMISASLYGLGDTTSARMVNRELIPSFMRISKPKPSGAQVRQACYLGLWRASVDDKRGTEEIRRAMQRIATLRAPADSISPRIALDAKVCEAELAAVTAGPETQLAATERLDSMAVTVAAGTDDDRNRLTFILTRMWQRLHRPDRALIAVRRNASGSFVSFVALLREEGGVSLSAGDTAAAIKAWSHYLGMRTMAEPEARKADDVIRGQLDALRAEPPGAKKP